MSKERALIFMILKSQTHISFKDHEIVYRHFNKLIATPSPSVRDSQFPFTLNCFFFIIGTQITASYLIRYQ